MLNFQVCFIRPGAEIVSWLIQDSNFKSLMFMVMGFFFFFNLFFLGITFDQCLNPSVLLSITC